MRLRQPRLPFSRRCRFVRQEAISETLRERRLTHQDLAGLLGLRLSTWFCLIHRRRPLSLRVRLLMLACPALVGVAEADLWETVELPPKDSP